MTLLKRYSLFRFDWLVYRFFQRYADVPIKGSTDHALSSILEEELNLKISTMIIQAHNQDSFRAGVQSMKRAYQTFQEMIQPVKFF